MSFLDNLFGSKVQIQQAPTVDPGASAQSAQNINQNAVSAFGNYAPQLAGYVQNLFNQQNPNVQAGLNTNYNLGTQLANTGTTSAMTGAMNYYRQLGLQTAAATGAPVTSAFAQNLGGSLGANQILQNQLQGSSILGQNTQQQSQLGMQFLQPSYGVLSSSLTTPSQVAGIGLQNASLTNSQNNLASQANAQANPAAAWMVNEVATIFNNLAGSAAGLAMA